MAAYYVSPTGSDLAAGTSAGAAWLTLSKVNGFSFASGDTILLQRGGRWRETLTVPRSNLTFGAYGATATFDGDGYCTNAPIVDGGSTIASWASYSGGVTDSYLTDDFAGTSGNDITGSIPEVGTGAWSAVAGTCVFSSDGMVRRDGSTAQSQYKHAVAPPVPDYYVTANVRVKTLLTVDLAYVIGRTSPSGVGDTSFAYAAIGYASGAGLFRLGWQNSGTNVFFDTAVTIAGATTYDVRLELEGDEVRGYLDDVLIDTQTLTGIMRTFQNAPGQVGFKLGTGSTTSGADGTGMQLVDIDAGPLGAASGSPSPTNTYQANLATDPLLVDIRGSYSVPGAGPNLLEDGEFSWHGSKLYVRSDSGAPVSGDVQVGVRDYCINVATNASITIEDIAVEHSRGQSISSVNGTGLTLNRVYGQLTSGSEFTAPSACVVVTGTHTGFSMTDCVIRDTGGDCVYLNYCPGVVITDCILGPGNGSGADCIQHDGSGQTIGGTISGCTMTGSTVSPKGLLLIQGHSWSISDCTFEGATNFQVASFGNNVEVENCTFHGVQASIPGTGGAFEITDNSATAVSGYQVHNNVFVDCNPAINVWSAGTATRTNLLFYNNTIVNVDVDPTEWQVDFQVGISGEFKNNILYDFTGTGKNYRYTTLAGGWNSDYNLIGPNDTGFIEALSAAYNTLAAFQAGADNDEHSISSNPTFVDEDGDATDGESFKLRFDSPAAMAGVLIDGYATDIFLGALGVKPAPVPLTIDMLKVPPSLEVGDAIEVQAVLHSYLPPTGLPAGRGGYVDPEEVAFEYRIGAGPVSTAMYGTSLAVVREAAGVYSLILDLDTAGTWHVRVVSSGDYQGVEETSFVVEDGSF